MATASTRPSSRLVQVAAELGVASDDDLGGESSATASFNSDRPYGHGLRGALEQIRLLHPQPNHKPIKIAG